MTKKILLVLAGMLIGCAAAVGIETVSAQHVDTPFPNSPAQTASNSGPTQYRECFSVSLDFISGRNLNAGLFPETFVQVPQGWTPIGGFGGQNFSSGHQIGMILCR